MVWFLGRLSQESPSAPLSHWHRRGHTFRRKGAARHRPAWRATTVTEKGIQQSDRIRHLDQPGECRKEPGQDCIAQGKQPGLVCQFTHEQTAFGKGSPLLLPLLRLDLGQTCALSLQLLTG